MAFFMFQRTLALSNNPFDPNDPNHKPGWDNLAGEPLRVDKDPTLMDLFCWKLAGLQQSKTMIDSFLFNPHKPDEKPTPKRGILVIAGGKGTGKTTLASYVRRRVLQESTMPSDQWKSHDTYFPEVDDPTRPTAFVDRVNSVRAEIGGIVGQQPENIFLFLDDVPSGGFGAINNLYRDFSKHMQVYVMTTTDVGLKQEELDWTVATRVKVINTRNVTAPELQAYMADRVRRYRDPARTEFDNLSTTFPWASSAVHRLVGDKAIDQPLRLLNRWLRDEVAEYHLKYSGDPKIDMTTLATTELTSLMIP